MDLMKDEKIVYETRPLPSTAWMLIILGIISAFLIVGIFIFIAGLSMLKTRIVLTNKRFAVKSWFSTKEMRLDKIESVEKKFWYNVMIYGSGGNKIQIQTKDWNTLVNEIHDALDKIKR